MIALRHVTLCVGIILGSCMLYAHAYGESAVNLKKYMYTRDFVEQQSVAGTVTFDVPADIVEKIYTLDDIELVHKETAYSTPLFLITRTDANVPERTRVYPREVYRGNGKLIYMVPAGLFSPESILDIGIDGTQSGGGTVSFFYTGINLGIDWSYWQVIAKDIPISVHSPYKSIIRSLTDVRIGTLIERSQIRRTEFDYDPQIMIVYRPGNVPNADSVPHAMNLSIEPADPIHTMPLYGYIEESTDTSSTFIVDMRQQITTHFGVHITVRDDSFASYVKVYTSPDKNTWTQITTDSIWSDTHVQEYLVGEDTYIEYPATNDRYIRIDFMSPLRVHPLVQVSYVPLSFGATFTEQTDLQNMQLVYGVPTAYQTLKNGVGDTTTAATTTTREAHVRADATEIILGPEKKNDRFFPLEKTEDARVASVYSYSALALYGETGIIVIISSIVLGLMWLVVFRKRT